MAAAPRKTPSGPSNDPGKFLTFTLGAEDYGVPVLRVREIIKMVPITQVPQLPGHVRGVINLRGKVIPVIDLRMKLGLPYQDETDATCIIVVEVTIDGAPAPVGILVDTVSEVANVAASDLAPTPAFGDGVRVDCLSGLAKLKGKVVLLLDLDRALGAPGFSF